MKRLIRILLRVFLAVPLLAVVALWVRSHFVSDTFMRVRLFEIRNGIAVRERSFSMEDRRAVLYDPTEPHIRMDWHIWGTRKGALCMSLHQTATTGKDMPRREQIVVMVYQGSMKYMGADRLLHQTQPAIWGDEIRKAANPLDACWQYLSFGFFSNSQISKLGSIHSGYGITIPYWLPTTILSLLLFLTFKRRRKSQPGHCLHCNYDLRNIPHTSQCPECGHRIPSANPP